MWVVIILLMCRHSDTVICSPMLCEWLLYCSCVVTVIQLYVAQCYVGGCYIEHVSPLGYCCFIHSTRSVSLHRAVRGIIPVFAWTHIPHTEWEMLLSRRTQPQDGSGSLMKKGNLSLVAHNKKKRCDTRDCKLIAVLHIHCHWSRYTWTWRTARERPSWNSPHSARNKILYPTSSSSVTKAAW